MVLPSHLCYSVHKAFHPMYRNTIVLFDKYLDSLGGGELHAICLLLGMCKIMKKRGLIISPVEDVDTAAIERKFNLDLSSVDFETIPDNQFIPQKYEDCCLFINATENSVVKGVGQTNIMLVFFPIIPSSMASISQPLSRILSYFPGKLFSLGSNFLGRYKSIDDLDSYQCFLANSEYTWKWVSKRWNINADVLYPPIDVQKFRNNIVKRNKIIAVGRFFRGNAFVKSHEKRQDILIDAFKRLVDTYGDSVQIKDLELDLVGSCGTNKRDLEYLEELKRSAEGYKVNFHINPEFEALKQLYARSLVFWHATGYGLDEKLHPEQMEHFGITTIEAMAAGCIPIVINKGGQKETVQHGVSGFLWDTTDEMITETYKVLENKYDNISLRINAIKSVQKYTYEEFNKKLKQIAQKLALN